MSENNGCSERFCYVRGKNTGMVTNGGCRCIKDIIQNNSPAVAEIEIKFLLLNLHNQIAEKNKDPKL